MSMVGLPPDQFVMEWRRSWLKGLMKTYIARGETKIPGQKLAKTLRTSVVKGKVTEAGLVTILQAIEGESVEPFRGRADYSGRRDRFEWLISQISKGLGNLGASPNSPA